MANQWFKFYGAEYLSDPKMDRLTVQERSCWLTLLCMASQTGGVVKYLSIEGLLNKSGIHFDPYDTLEWDNAQNVLKTFELYKMVTILEDGSVEIRNWRKRQEHNLTVAERVAKHRAKRKDVTPNVTNDVTSVTGEYNRIEYNNIDIPETSSGDSKKKKREEPKPFDFKVYLKDLENNSRRDINVIGHFFEAKGLTFTSRETANAALKRHLRPAKEVAKFTDSEIVSATEEARKQYPEMWTVDTLLKILTR